MATDPVFIGAPKGYANSITNSTTAVDLVTGATNGTRLEGLTVWNAHSSSATVEIYFHDGSTAYVIARKSVSANTAWNVIAEMFPATPKQMIILDSGKKIQVKTPTAVAGTVGIYAMGGDF